MSDSSNPNIRQPTRQQAILYRTRLLLFSKLLLYVGSHNCNGRHKQLALLFHLVVNSCLNYACRSTRINTRTYVLTPMSVPVYIFILRTYIFIMHSCLQYLYIGACTVGHRAAYASYHSLMSVFCCD